jgi:hypothetical protein
LRASWKGCLRSTRPVVLIGGHVTGRDEGGLHVYVEQTLTSGTFIQSESHFDDGALVHIADLYAGLGVFSQKNTHKTRYGSRVKKQEHETY